MFASILLAEDEKNARQGLVSYLEAKGYDVYPAQNGQEALKIFKEQKPDLVLTDIRMPELNGILLLEKIHAEKPSTPVILMTAYGSVEDAVKAMKKGAFYYLTKPVNLEELDFLVSKALTSRALQEENIELKKALFTQKFDRGEILGTSLLMKKILQLVDRVAPSSSTVLILGESGTGKELIAHRIHELSPRKDKPFIAVHCAALPESLLASELFGHERGAFTGATERKIGRFERAHQGTLFLDEIGEISSDMQVKLLRVLQEGEFERLGGAKTIKVDVRLIAATNKNLRAEVEAGRFREDLYYRINVIEIKLPPLRERKEDIPLLAQHFIDYFSNRSGNRSLSITPDALKQLSDYDWPGNIRELRNIVERMVVLSSGESLDMAALPEDIRPKSNSAVTGSNLSISSSASLSDMEKEHIKLKLAECKGNKSKAADALGISRRTLYRKLEEYGLTNL